MRRKRTAWPLSHRRLVVDRPFKIGEVVSKAVTRAISIRQPWAELILRRTKKAEYRSRPTRIRERVYLYASKTPVDAPAVWGRLGKRPGELANGLIVGSVEIVDCRWDEQRQHYVWVLAKPIRFRVPLRAKNNAQPTFWLPRF